MARVNPEDLEKVLAEAGISERTKEKVRKANQPTAAVKGHGAPAEPANSYMP